MKNLKHIILFAVYLALFSCKKDQLEIKKTVDPCECASEVSADFVIEEIALWGLAHKWYTETDSILKGSRVRFRAKEDVAEYKWYIGIEELDQPSVIRYFESQWTGSNIPITLVVRKEPNNVCFPLDDGYDSITKVLNVTEYSKVDPNNSNNMLVGTLEGNFRMIEKNATDSIEVGIDFVINSLNTTYINFYNYDGSGGECIEFHQPDLGINYREFRTGDAGGQICKRLRAVVKTPSLNNVEMRFTEYEPGHPEYKIYHYKGRRLGPL